MILKVKVIVQVTVKVMKAIVQVTVIVMKVIVQVTVKVIINIKQNQLIFFLNLFLFYKKTKLIDDDFFNFNCR